MVYDLLKLNGSVYNYDIETEGGKAETKSHILDERDAIWVELRHQHFAAASLRISSMLDDFRQKNKAASYVRSKGGVVSLTRPWKSPRILNLANAQDVTCECPRDCALLALIACTAYISK